jgi:hypothetical protein
VKVNEEKRPMSEEKHEETPPGDPAWVTDPELQLQMMHHLYLQASDESRALMAPLFEQLGLPLPFTVAQPPDQATPKMAIAALNHLLQQSARLGRENARVSLGVSQIDQELGARMISGFFLALKGYQDLLKDVIEQLKAKDEGQSSS